jgi:hypothetical protein
MAEDEKSQFIPNEMELGTALPISKKTGEPMEVIGYGYKISIPVNPESRNTVWISSEFSRTRAYETGALDELQADEQELVEHVTNVVMDDLNQKFEELKAKL